MVIAYAVGPVYWLNHTILVVPTLVGWALLRPRHSTQMVLTRQLTIFLEMKGIKLALSSFSNYRTNR